MQATVFEAGAPGLYCTLTPPLIPLVHSLPSRLAAHVWLAELTPITNTILMSLKVHSSIWCLWQGKMAP